MPQTICPKCYTKTESDTGICPNCGADLTQQPIEPNIYGDEKKVADNYYIKKNPTRNILIFMVALVVVGLGVSYVLFNWIDLTMPQEERLLNQAYQLVLDGNYDKARRKVNLRTDKAKTEVQYYIYRHELMGEEMERIIGKWEYTGEDGLYMDIEFFPGFSAYGHIPMKTLTIDGDCRYEFRDEGLVFSASSTGGYHDVGYTLDIQEELVMDTLTLELDLGDGPQDYLFYRETRP